MKKPEPLILSHRSLFTGFNTVSELKVRTPSSIEISREVISRPPAVCVLPVLVSSLEVCFIDQWRPGAFIASEQGWVREIIAGGVGFNEDPEEAVRREALEEADLKLGRMTKIGEYFVSPGYSSEVVSLFCAEVAERGEGFELGVPEEGEMIQREFVRLCDIEEPSTQMSIPAAFCVQWLKATLSGPSKNAPLWLQPLIKA